MLDLIVLLVVFAVVGGAARYIYKEKKHGAACIGCPYAGSCSSCSCGKHAEEH